MGRIEQADCTPWVKQFPEASDGRYAFRNLSGARGLDGVVSCSPNGSTAGNANYNEGRGQRMGKQIGRSAAGGSDRQVGNPETSR